MKRLPILFFSLAVLCCGAGDAWAGAQKKTPKAIIRFHPEAASEGDQFAVAVQNLHTGRHGTMAKIPLISEGEIVSFEATRVADGSYGVCFKLDYHGGNLLSQHTMSRRGSWLYVFLNGRHVIDLYVDRAVKNAEICIPSGITAGELALIEQSFPKQGHENESPNQKSAKSGSTP